MRLRIVPNVSTSDRARIAVARQGRPAGRGGRAARRAFTLLEIILAVAIATGLLLVVLYFYRQAAELREHVMREAERIAAIRLVMDRLTGELRSVPASSSSTLPLYGDATTLEFIRTDLSGRAAWATAELGRVVAPESDLRFVRYTAGDGILTFALSRREETLVGRRVLPVSANALAPVEGSQTNAPVPLTEEIQFVRFRYWNGREWQELWNEPAPPPAVEISLGLDPLPEDATPDEYPHELFRRVVFLPAGSPAPVTAALSGVTGRREPQR